MKKYDVAIIGGGAAGMAAAGALCERGRRTLLLDLGQTPARKVAASGGGRCNFTNMAAGADRYFGENPNFVRGALARVGAADMLRWGEAHGLTFSEKAAGQYFCDNGAGAVVAALARDAQGADIKTSTVVHGAEYENSIFKIITDREIFWAEHIIIATGGISFGALGVSETGYQIARRFGHKVIPPRPGLCAIKTGAFSESLAGISQQVEIKAGGRKIQDSLLFTHFGIGGPAAYRASLADANTDICINFLPGVDVFEWLRAQKKLHGRKSPANVLGAIMPMGLARYFAGSTQGNIADIRDSILRDIAGRIQNTTLPAGTWRHHGMAAAEVTFGGVSTENISSKTMESKLQAGLFFAGEVMDITGDLGGFNLQWAWASGRVAGNNA